MTDNSTKTKASRLTRGLLIGSLTLNFLIIGGAIGLLVSSKNHRQPPTSSFSTGAFTKALDEEQRVEVRESLKARMDSRRKIDRQEHRRVFSALLSALRQNPFDRAAVVSEINSIEQQGAARRTQGTDALLDAIEAMTAPEREAYVDRLERDLKRKRPSSRKAPTRE